MSTWLITGCSTGLGRALAEAVIAEGHNAVVTARDVDKVADLAADEADRVLPLPLDVTETAQMRNGGFWRSAQQQGSDLFDRFLEP